MKMTAAERVLASGVITDIWRALELAAEHHGAALVAAELHRRGEAQACQLAYHAERLRDVQSHRAILRKLYRAAAARGIAAGQPTREYAAQCLERAGMDELAGALRKRDYSAVFI